MLTVLEMKGGGGLLVQKFLRYGVYGLYGISVVNTKMFINKKLDKQSWHCSINPGSYISPGATPDTPSYGVNFFGTQTEYFSVKSLSVATLSHSAGNKLEGDWGEIVALGAEISP